MGRPRLLDLFSGAGGAALGYARAGFEVVGVDHRPMPGYPSAFVLADALEYLAEHGREYHAIHASPPCQAFTAYRRKGHGVGAGAADLIAAVRRALDGSGRPYVIENVPGAPLGVAGRRPLLLCGSMFGLDVRRHRLFEASWELPPGPACRHALQRARGSRFPAATNRASNGRSTVEIGVWRIPLDVQRRAMGIDWMDLEELSQAIPPAYTEWVGRRLLERVARLGVLSELVG
jgi:DNA (cytosine-5)-methyltransferase 1